MKRFFLLILTIFLFSCINKKNEAKQSQSIEIVYFNTFDTTLIPDLCVEIKQFYNLKTVKISSAELPNSAFYTPRKRYRADSLIKNLAAIKSKQNKTIIGLCNTDISVSINNSNDWGVFGFGYCPGNACIISTYRLKKDEKPGFHDRFKNVVLHEIGHNLGLEHCPNTSCLMADAKGKMSSVEGSNRKLCLNCQSLIYGN